MNGRYEGKRSIKTNKMNSEGEDSKEENEAIAKETLVACAIEGQYSQHFILFKLTNLPQYARV
jgi:hypothetical protein